MRTIALTHCRTAIVYVKKPPRDYVLLDRPYAIRWSEEKSGNGLSTKRGSNEVFFMFAIYQIIHV